MPFQLIWEYEEVFEIVYSESPWYYLSKTHLDQLFERKMPEKIQLQKKSFFVNLAVGYKLVMIIMQSVFICLSVCIAIYVSAIL